MKKFVILSIVLVASLAYNGWSYFQTNQMRTVVTLLEGKDRLQQQQVNDLLMSAINRNNENVVEVARGQGKIEGMLAIMAGQKPDASEATQLWHAGYYRGLDQAKDMKTLSADDTITVTDKESKKK